MTYLLAARHPEVKLILPFYGHLVAFSPPDGNKPNSPLDEAGEIGCRVLGFYGSADPSIPVDQVTAMEAKLRRHDPQAVLQVIEGAPHCFFRTPEWQKASDQAWVAVLQALKETLG